MIDQSQSRVILPTVGRHVHFFPNETERYMVRRSGQPLHAVVLFVHNERRVNLQVVDHDGNVYTEAGAVLVQPDDAFVTGSSHCRWPEFGPAKPVAAGEPVISAALADLIETTATSLKPEDLAGVGLGADGTPAGNKEQA